MADPSTSSEFRQRYDLDSAPGPFIVALHHAITDPSQAVAPHSSDIAFDEPGFLDAAHYLMIVLLGWSNPAKGLLWWMEQGQDPRGSPHLQLLKDRYAPGGYLDQISAYYFSRSSLSQWRFFPPLAARADRRLCPPVAFTPPAAWWNQIRLSSAAASPSNYLFIEYCWNEAGTPPHSPTLLNGSNGVRQARLTLPAYQGWASALEHSASSLGSLGWGIDVLTPPVGFLGSFHRSPITGLWFQGSHEIHLAGNLHPQARTFGNPESQVSEVAVDDQAIASFASSRLIKLEPAGDHLNFPFRPGEIRRSASGRLRTIVGFGYDAKGIPVYILRSVHSDTLVCKPTYKAHLEYSPIISFSSSSKEGFSLTR